MAGATMSLRSPRLDLGKGAFFLILALCVVPVILVDERFVVDPADPTWRHIAPYKWLLLPHAVAGVATLLAGPLQFSDALRAARPRLHRRIGWTYAVAALLAAVLGTYIAIVWGPPVYDTVEWFHGGLIPVALAMAILAIRRRDLAAHKLWMMRSYLIALIFVLGRLPDLLPHHPGRAFETNLLWSGVVLGLVGPDLALAVRAQRRRAAASNAQAPRGRRA